MSTEASETTDTAFAPIQWLPQGKVRFLDQTLLPNEERWIETDDYRVIAEAIRRLQVRGAPLIGIAGAYGLALSAAATGEDIEAAAADLRSTRPTAVNLSWALDRCLRSLVGVAGSDSVRERLTAEAIAIHQEDIAGNHNIGKHGAALLGSTRVVLTHCNAGALATGGYGTALGVIRSAHKDGRVKHVYVDETRPLLQGTRLTAWELERDGIGCTVIVDSAAGSYIRRGGIDAVITGADRITANGDVANKIGTYSLAVLARENNIPFYVAAPTSTLDLSLASGDDIPIEQRSPREITSVGSQAVAPAGVDAENPAFDVTPNEYVTAIITENGAARLPYTESLRRVCSPEVSVRG
jgi:methylthioribose-1-phosphate isomerase